MPLSPAIAALAAKLSPADRERAAALALELRADKGKLVEARANLKAAGVSPDVLDARRVRDSFKLFVERFWEVVEPERPFVSAPHIDAICDHLQAVAEGKIRRLLVNVPPGHAKSLLVAVMWPAWMWLRQPGWRVLTGSYAMDLAIRDAQRSREVITSSQYENVKRLLGLDWRMSGDQNVKSNYANDALGFRMAVSVGSKATGFRGDCLIFDDLVNAKEPEKLTREALETARSWWRVTMSSRLNDLRTGVKIGIMQRVSEFDPCADIIRSKRNDGTFEYDLVALPSEFNPDLYRSLGRPTSTTSIGWKDWRTQRGELLFPTMFPAEVIADAKNDLQALAYSAQHGQMPVPAGGGFFKGEWWRFWVPEGIAMPAPVIATMPDGKTFECPQVRLPQLRSHFMSCDLTFKDTVNADFVAMQVWAWGGVDGFRQGRFLLDQVHKRLDFTATLREFRRLCETWPQAGAKLVEDKANGPAVISSLKDSISGIIAVNPLGGKEARANAVSSIVESGCVYLPHPAIFPWVRDFLAEVSSFPRGAHDDQVDAMTQALARKNVAVV